jgi:hypothetical protein
MTLVKKVRIQWTIGWETLVYIVGDEIVKTDLFIVSHFLASLTPRFIYKGYLVPNVMG